MGLHSSPVPDGASGLDRGWWYRITAGNDPAGTRDETCDLRLTRPCLRRGSKFLKAWTAWLEENADLRYPDQSEVMGGG